MIAQHRKKKKVHFPSCSSSDCLVALKVFHFKMYFSSITTLQNGTFYLLLSFVSGSEAENESQIVSGLLNLLASWFSTVYLESKRGLWIYYS